MFLNAITVWAAKLKSPKGMILVAPIAMLAIGAVCDAQASRFAHKKLQQYFNSYELSADANHIEFSFLGFGPEVNIKNLSISDPDRPPLLHSANIDLQLSWINIIRGIWTPTHATVSDAKMVALVSDLRNNWSKFIPLLNELSNSEQSSKVEGQYTIETTQFTYINTSANQHTALNIEANIVLEENPQESSMKVEGTMNEQPLMLKIDGNTSEFTDLQSLSANLDFDVAITNTVLSGQVEIKPSEDNARLIVDGELSTNESNDAEVNAIAASYDSADTKKSIQIPKIKSKFQSILSEDQLDIITLSIKTRRSDLTVSGSVNYGAIPVTFDIDANSATLHSADFSINESVSKNSSANKRSGRKAVFATSAPQWHQHLAKMDGDFDFHIERFFFQGIPATDLQLALSLKDQALKANLDLAGEDESAVSTKFKYAIEADNSVTGAVGFKISNMQINEIPFLSNVADVIPQGAIMAEGDFWFAGETPAEMAGDLDGDLYLLIEEGELDAFAVEVMGADLMEVVKLVFDRDLQQVDIKCAFANISAESGKVTIGHLLMDSEDTFFSGTGHVDLVREKVNILITPKPHDASLFSAVTPIKIVGDLSDPKVRPGKRLYLKLVSAAALATISGPAATLIPFLSYGKGTPSDNCTDLLSAY